MSGRWTIVEEIIDACEIESSHIDLGDGSRLDTGYHFYDGCS
jgi:hypothetical protein